MEMVVENIREIRENGDNIGENGENGENGEKIGDNIGDNIREIKKSVEETKKPLRIKNINHFFIFASSITALAKLCGKLQKPHLIGEFTN